MPTSPAPRARRWSRSSTTTTTTCRPARPARWARRSPTPTAASTTSVDGWASRGERGSASSPWPSVAARRTSPSSGPAAAVILREGRMYELPPPPAVHEEDPRVRERRVAATLGEALEIQPYTWHGELAPGDRLALVSRNLAQVVGVEELKQALASLRPSAAVEHVERLFQIRGGKGSDGILAIEIIELPLTATTRQLEPVRPSEPLAGLPGPEPGPAGRCDRPLPAPHGRRDRRPAGAARRGGAVRLQLPAGVHPAPPAAVPTADPAHGGRRGGATPAAGHGRDGRPGGHPGGRRPASPACRRCRPTEAIPRAPGGAAGDRGRDRPDGRRVGAGRRPGPGRARPGGSHRAAERRLRRAATGGSAPAWRPAALDRLRDRVEGGLDRIYAVARLHDTAVIADLAVAYPPLEPFDMVVASDGSLWVAETAPAAG